MLKETQGEDSHYGNIKDCEEDEESVRSSNHFTFQNEYDSLTQMKINEELEDVIMQSYIYP